MKKDNKIKIELLTSQTVILNSYMILKNNQELSYWGNFILSISLLLFSFSVDNIFRIIIVIFGFIYLLGAFVAFIETKKIDKIIKKEIHKISII